MKNCCEDCRFKKDKPTGNYCVKYGIPVFSEKTYCVAYERDAIRAWRDNEQVRKPENAD